MGQALKELSRLGWQATCGWWQWTYPGTLAPVNMALESQEAVEHVVKEELRKRELLQVEHRRPRLFAGIAPSLGRGSDAPFRHLDQTMLTKTKTLIDVRYLGCILESSSERMRPKN